MKDLILDLARYIAPSGTERTLQDALLAYVTDVADEVHIDTLGNGIARKRGSGPHVLLAAHADESGVMVIDIGEDGFLRLVSIGDLKPNTLIGRHVHFTNGVVGVVGVEKDILPQDVSFDHLYVDIAADSFADAAEKTFIGLSGVIVEPIVELNDIRLAGRALDNRVGCAIAIEAFRLAAAENRNVTLVFTAQNAVGARGAKTVAYQLNPDLAIVIDAAPAGDMPEAPRMSLQLGKGPAVKIMDRTAVVPIAVKDHLIDAAKSVGLTTQFEVWPHGGSDAGSIQLSVEGVAVGGVSYPARYLGGPSSVIDLRDASAAVTLIAEAIRRVQVNA